MPLSNADNPVAETPAEAPTPKAAKKAAELQPTGASGDPEVHFLVSKRAHLVGAIAEAGDQVAAIDKQLATLGYRAE